jgi:hypothetical protein
MVEAVGAEKVRQLVRPGFERAVADGFSVRGHDEGRPVRVSCRVRAWIHIDLPTAIASARPQQTIAHGEWKYVGVLKEIVLQALVHVGTQRLTGGDDPEGMATLPKVSHHPGLSTEAHP